MSEIECAVCSKPFPREQAKWLRTAFDNPTPDEHALPAQVFPRRFYDHEVNGGLPYCPDCLNSLRLRNRAARDKMIGADNKYTVRL